jgi:hypothetical protein
MPRLLQPDLLVLGERQVLPDNGVSWIEGIPPRSRNHREPTGPDTPHASTASSLVKPSAIFFQNARSTPRLIGGLPGDRIAGLPVIVVIHPACRPIRHLLVEVCDDRWNSPTA